jgi:hypothetical protein
MSEIINTAVQLAAAPPTFIVSGLGVVTAAGLAGARRSPS